MLYFLMCMTMLTGRKGYIMLNPKKIKWMTKASVYEEKEEKGALKVNRYFRGDYICYGMIKAAVGITVSTVLIFAVWLLVHAEELMTTKTYEELVQIGVRLVFCYAVALIIYLCIAFFVYHIRYRAMQKSLKGYLETLKQIKKIQSKEKQAAETVREEHETW
jgi:hypothetical protein